MPSPFLQADPELLHACHEHVVVTANERLRRELVRAYDTEQLQSGQQAWSSASVWSLQGFLADQHRVLADRDALTPRLLSADAERLLFQTLAPAGLSGLSDLAMQAWRLAHDWEIPLEPGSAVAATENGRAFLQWAGRVTRELEASQTITQAQLPAVLMDKALPTSKRLLALGFETTPKAITGLFSAWQSRGLELEWRQPSSGPTGEAAVCDFASPAEELNAMAQWVRALLTQAKRPETLRIGIVIPNLTDRYLQIERQFSAQLEPTGSQAVATQFDIAGGVPLGSQPIWTTARDLLDLCLLRLPCERLLALLNSKYLELRPPRQLDPNLPADIALWELVQLHDEPSLVALNRLCPPAESLNTLDQWLDLFARLLARAGLRGRGAQSRQSQAWEQVQQCMGELSGAGPAGRRPCTAEEALQPAAVRSRAEGLVDCDEAQLDQPAQVGPRGAPGRRRLDDSLR